MNRFVTMLGAGAVAIMLSGGAWAATDSAVTPAQIASARTPADHEAIAAAYDKEAMRLEALAKEHETMAKTITIFVSFFIIFTCALAFGVTYNAARIALSERGRELATLRVLGFTRAEISYILLGEVALLTFVALPLGCAAGFGLASLIVRAFETELYRVPLVILPSRCGWAMVIGLTATAVSAFLVRRRADRLDLIAVLKTRE